MKSATFSASARGLEDPRIPFRALWAHRVPGDPPRAAIGTASGGSLGAQVRHAHQFVGRGHQVAGHPLLAGAPETAHRLHPAENLLDQLALPLADPIASVARPLMAEFCLRVTCGITPCVRTSFARSRVSQRGWLRRTWPEPPHPGVVQQDPPGFLAPALAQQSRLGVRAALVRFIAQPPSTLKCAFDGRLRALAANTIWPNRPCPLPWSRGRRSFIGKSPGSKLRSIKSNPGNQRNNRVSANSLQKKRSLRTGQARSGGSLQPSPGCREGRLVLAYMVSNAGESQSTKALIKRRV